MLAISRRARQFLGTQTSTIMIRLDNLVVLVVLVVALVAFDVLVAFVVLAAFLAAFLIALTALIVFDAIAALVALIVAAVAVVAAVNSSSFLTKTVAAKEKRAPLHEFLQGLFSIRLDIRDKLGYIG